MSTTGSQATITTSAGLRGVAGADGTSAPTVVAFTSTIAAVVNLNALAANNVVPWDAEIIKDAGFVHSNTTTPSRIEVGFTGRVRVTARVALGGTGSSFRYIPRVHLRINGATSVLGVMSGTYARNTDLADNSTTLGDWLFSLVTGDYFEILIDRVTVATEAMNTISNESMIIVERRT